MTPPKPPRKNSPLKSTITSSPDSPQDTSKPAVNDKTSVEVIVKPVPHPRTKTLRKEHKNDINNVAEAEDSTNNTAETQTQPKEPSHDTTSTADSEDSTSSTTSGDSSPLSEYPAQYKRPRPARPPPPRHSTLQLTLSEPTGGTRFVNVNTEAAEEPPGKGTETKQSTRRPPPARPPPPSIYYDRLPCTTRPKSEDTERPAVPPRLEYSSLPCSTSEYDFSPEQTRPPPPSFDPPPPPSIETTSDTIYSEIDYRPYLDVLPEDNQSMTLRRSTMGSVQQFPSSFYNSYPRVADDTEDIIGMLRWLKRVSKSDSMAPSLYGLTIEEEVRSFNQRAMNVRKALRLFNLLMMKRNETLRDIIAEFNALCESLDKVHKMSKTMGIAGGTTGAVGGVTAVLGIALAPVTFGASLIATAVGAGMVASAGGISVHTAKAGKKVVNRMTVEKLVYDYKANVVDLEQCLDFILSEMNELRRHDIARLQRAGAPLDAIKTAHLSQSVFRVNDNRKGPHIGGMASERLLQAFAKEMDEYFTEKNDQKLRKSTRSRFCGRMCLLAKNLQSELDYLNLMWELLS
ncbi:uncharacterized protein LOC117809465 [Xyrichtys novacula]|uniref:Uncharacterized protein LOC117809465 n=1 Tax=Xyrichtys novacula TaxID=13765 RepID=A0AAV1GRJ9_XYRNO|nr:uncharacterized protein LOC117809465 [Xyrichtys novacula]